MSWRVYVETDDVLDLLGEPGIATHFESPGAVRFEVMRPKNLGDSGEGAPGGAAEQPRSDEAADL